MVKERLFIGPRMHGIDAGMRLGVWTSDLGNRFWRRTIGGATYEFAVHADGHTLVTRWAPGAMHGRIVHDWH